MSYKTIVLRGDGVNNEETCDSAIKPGMLVERTATGIKPHSDATAKAQAAFALEDELQGNGIDTDYAADDIAQFRQFNAGDRVFACIADGENVAAGDKLCSNGDGYLKVDADPFASAVGIALEALDRSNSSGADPESIRTVVEIM